MKKGIIFLVIGPLVTVLASGLVGCSTKSTLCWDAGRGLLAYWTFDEGNGTTLHDCVGGHHGTIYGLPAWEKGVSGHCMRFDGVDDFVEVPDVTDFRCANQSLTYSAWVQIVDNPDKYRVFVHLGDPVSAREIGISLVKARSGNPEYEGRILMNLRNGAPVAYLAQSSQDGDQLPKNEWLFLAGVVDCENSLVTLYIDGNHQQSVALPDFECHLRTRSNSGLGWQPLGRENTTKVFSTRCAFTIGP